MLSLSKHEVKDYWPGYSATIIVCAVYPEVTKGRTLQGSVRYSSFAKLFLILMILPSI